ncbi:MAG TPA: sulfatase [Armatimonadota bacterium]|nr:sulfatase [Armatimonadota bacterium]
MGSKVKAHLVAAAPVGVAAGAVLGVTEAVAAAAAGQRLPAPNFWLMWVATVAAYAILGWVVFVVAAIVTAAISGLSKRRTSPPSSGPYWIAAAAMLPAAWLLGRADLELPEPALAFRLLPVGVACLAAGAMMAGAIRFTRARVRSAPERSPRAGGAAAAGVAGYAAGGALWAHWSGGGLSGVERLGAIAVGVALGLVVLAAARRKGRARRDSATLAWLLGVGPLAAAAAIAVPALWAASLPAPRGAPDVLLVTVDALRADHLGAYGSKQGLTPSLDRFAGDAVVFERAFSSAPWTAASVGSMMVSRYPSELGLVPVDRSQHQTRYGGGVLTPQPTLAEVLRRGGYLTIADVPNPQLRRDRGFARGFLRFNNPDDFSGERAPALPRLGKYEEWFLHTSIGLRAAQRLHREPRYYRAPRVELDDAERIVRDAALARGRRGRRPQLLWLHLMDPHVPYDPPQKSAATIAAFPRPPLDPTPRFYKDVVWGKVTPDQRQRRYMHALYRDEVHYADQWLGFLFDRMQRLGLYRDALIIVTADHGEEFWDHGGFEHGHTLYDELLHVPLVIKFPRNRAAGERVSARASLLDLLPTVAQAAGLPVPRGARGTSLMSLAGAGKGAADKRTLFAEFTLYGEELKGLRTARYKVIFHARSRGIEVYDLHTDPAERHNLARDPQVAPEARRLLTTFARDSERRTARWARSAGSAPSLDARTRESLRSIGYLGG